MRVQIHSDEPQVRGPRGAEQRAGARQARVGGAAAGRWQGDRTVDAVRREGHKPIPPLPRRIATAVHGTGRRHPVPCSGSRDEDRVAAYMIPRHAPRDPALMHRDKMQHG